MRIENNMLHAIKIRPLAMDDFITALHWSKDDDFCSANGWEQNRADEEVYQWWLRCVTQSADDFIRMGIEQDGRLIGYVDLAFIKGNSAELGIAIGESGLWSKGIGTQATKIMMTYALEHLGITVFHAETHEVNRRSRKMLEKVGFKEISREGSEQYLGEESQLIQYTMTLKGSH